MGLYRQIPQVTMYIRMQTFSTRNGGNTHTIDLYFTTSVDEVLPHQILHGHAMSSIQGRQALVNQSTPHGCHKDPRAYSWSKPAQNPTHTEGTTYQSLCKRWRQTGPQGVWPNRLCVCSSWPSMWSSVIGPLVHSRGASVDPSCPSPYK
jgi:hypothetical protein